MVIQDKDFKMMYRHIKTISNKATKNNKRVTMDASGGPTLNHHLTDWLNV